jgi:hypothetical protein
LCPDFKGKGGQREKKTFSPIPKTYGRLNGKRIVFIGKLLKFGLYSKQYFRKMHTFIIILIIGSGGDFHFFNIINLRK